MELNEQTNEKPSYLLRRASFLLERQLVVKIIIKYYYQLFGNSEMCILAPYIASKDCWGYHVVQTYQPNVRTMKTEQGLCPNNKGGAEAPSPRPDDATIYANTLIIYTWIFIYKLINIYNFCLSAKATRLCLSLYLPLSFSPPTPKK